MSSERLLISICLALLVVGFTLSCGGGGGGTPGGGTNGMPSVMTKVYSAVSATICPTGGIQVDAGIDDNGSGVLDASEVDSTQYVCNGLNGTNGTGSDGLSTLVAVVSEPAGTNCADGGSKVNVGLDADKDNVLDSTEISSSDYICNGENGTIGPNGSNGFNSLTAIVSEPVGTTCANGG